MSDQAHEQLLSCLHEVREDLEISRQYSSAAVVAQCMEELDRLKRTEERYLAALHHLASWDDEAASKRLQETGKYSVFDEPNAVEVAREALSGEGGHERD